MFHTDRLELRKWKIEDAESLYKYAKDPDVGYPAGWPAHKSIEDSKDVIKNVFNGEQCYAIVFEGEAIGAIELKLNGCTDMTDKDDECELGFWIGKPFWGKGFVKEASLVILRYGFLALGMTRIWCGYYEDNEKSKRVQEKIGFKLDHKTEDIYVSFFNEYRTGFANFMTREMFDTNYRKTVEDVVRSIRHDWAIADANRDEGLTTPEDIRRFDNITYGPYRADNTMDVYVQKSVNKCQPTIVNVHGGAWVYGCKEIYQFYCMRLAQNGFTVVNINYRLAPENKFPAALEDVNAVLEFIEHNGEEYFIDKNKLILVGDSAGAQIVSHYGTIYSNKEFAKYFSFKVPNVKVRALGLNCGLYDGSRTLLDYSYDMFTEYMGLTCKTVTYDMVENADIFSNITSEFPPSYIMTSEWDFLKREAKPMYEKLVSKGVNAIYKMNGSKDRPDLGHVFHINCRIPEAKICNDEECEFFRRILS